MSFERCILGASWQHGQAIGHSNEESNARLVLQSERVRRQIFWLVLKAYGRGQAEVIQGKHDTVLHVRSHDEVWQSDLKDPNLLMESASYLSVVNVLRYRLVVHAISVSPVTAILCVEKVVFTVAVAGHICI